MKSKKATRALTFGLSNKFCPKSKRSQVTIFVIVAVAIVAVVGGYFLVKSDVIPSLGDSGEVDPQGFLDTCLKDKIQEGIDLLLENGGYINPPLTIMHNNQNISYLCYNQNGYSPCVNQQSLLIRHLEKELYNYIENDVEDCFSGDAGLTSTLDQKGYTVTGARYGGFEVDLRDGEFAVDIDAELTLTKTGETSKQEDFSVVTPTRLYNLAMVVREIVSQEIKYCHFSDTGYNIMYPETRVLVDNIRDETKIYTVEDVKGIEKFWFAIRGCALR